MNSHKRKEMTNSEEQQQKRTRIDDTVEGILFFIKRKINAE